MTGADPAAFAEIAPRAQVLRIEAGSVSSTAGR